MKDVKMQGWIEIAKKAKQFAEQNALAHLDADRWLMRSMASFIELSAARYPLDPGAQWKAGQALKLMIVGYAGNRNTGADVRVEEMIRQFRFLLGDEHLSLSILTLNPQWSEGYFRTVKQIQFPKLFPKFLFDTVHAHHGVIAAEGSMFKSKFANALSTMMVGSLGLASSEQKLAVAYGGEAGAMDAPLEKLVRRYCKHAKVIVRNTQSASVLGALGIESTVGTDTAWTFDPAPPEVGQKLLKEKGWDGKRPVLTVCPINGYWWPVRPDLARAAKLAFNSRRDEDHYASIYFHHGGPDVKEKQERYLDELAKAVLRIQKEQDAFVALVGMERLDRKAAEALAARLSSISPALFISDEYDMYSLVSLLRQSTWLISSRFHAIVTSMPAQVLSIGVTMDERIANLMSDRGEAALSIDMNAPELAEKILTQFDYVQQHASQSKTAMAQAVVRNLKCMGQMGKTFLEALHKQYPDFPISEQLLAKEDPWAFLPELNDNLKALIKRYECAEKKEAS
ncbi:MAG: polysaccharide pyruvyl transferase family protein [Myxococcales bacterium]|nr:MAG: polysaccharide pyruvyl transferase family protein [Myxococcales bacterium]